MKHIFIFNPESNGGETIALETRFKHNGDEIIIASQELSLQAYGSSSNMIVYRV